MDTDAVPERVDETTVPDQLQEKPKPSKIKCKFEDFVPGTEQLQWFYYQKEALHNYVNGKTMIIADTNSCSSMKYCVLSLGEIEPLILSTPTNLSNF